MCVMSRVPGRPLRRISLTQCRIRTVAICRCDRCVVTMCSHPKVLDLHSLRSWLPSSLRLFDPINKVVVSTIPSSSIPKYSHTQPSVPSIREPSVERRLCSEPLHTFGKQLWTWSLPDHLENLSIGSAVSIRIIGRSQHSKPSLLHWNRQMEFHCYQSMRNCCWTVFLEMLQM